MQHVLWLVLCWVTRTRPFGGFCVTVGFECLPAAAVKSCFFWDLTLRSVIEVHQCFGATFCLYLQS
jgi:hypothetical protein